MKPMRLASAILAIAPTPMWRTYSLFATDKPQRLDHSRRESGCTVTATARLCSPPPRITPRSGITSP